MTTVSKARHITDGLTPDYFEHDDGSCITVIAQQECEAMATTAGGEKLYLFSDGSTLYCTDEQWSLTITPDTTGAEWHFNPRPASPHCDGCGELTCKCEEHYHELYECVPFIEWGAQ